MRPSARSCCPICPSTTSRKSPSSPARTTLNLARRDNLWRVRERGDYPANFSQISGLLLKLADLKIVQTEEVGPSQLGRFELLPPGAQTNSGTLVEFKDQSGKTLNTLLLGKTHMAKAARQFTDAAA